MQLLFAGWLGIYWIVTPAWLVFVTLLTWRLGHFFFRHSATSAQRRSIPDTTEMQHLVLVKAQGLTLQKTDSLDAARQAPRLRITRNAQTHTALAEAHQPGMSCPGVYCVGEGLVLRSVTLQQCTDVTLEGNAWTHPDAELALVLHQSTRVRVRNQRLRKLHLRMTQQCEIEFENVCCDVALVDFLGAASAITGLEVQRQLHLQAQLEGNRISSLRMRPETALTHAAQSRPVTLERVISPHSRAINIPQPQGMEDDDASSGSSASSNTSMSESLPAYVPAVGLLMPDHLRRPEPLYHVRLARPTEDPCILCTENYANTMTSCAHQSYCSTCLDEHRASIPATCPQCRAAIRTLQSFDAPSVPSSVVTAVLSRSCSPLPDSKPALRTIAPV